MFEKKSLLQQKKIAGRAPETTRRVVQQKLSINPTFYTTQNIVRINQFFVRSVDQRGRGVAMWMQTGVGVRQIGHYMGIETFGITRSA